METQGCSWAADATEVKASSVFGAAERLRLDLHMCSDACTPRCI